MRNKRMARVITLAALVSSATLAMAQSVISGVVKDSTGEPIVGVSVIQKGTTNGSATDADGKFSIKVEPGSTLTFSFIGYKPMEMAATSSMEVVLVDDSKLLSETVVIGYGVANRKDITSSITTISSEDLNLGVYTDPAQLLQGKVPALNITQNSDPNSGTSSISLRGASSLRSGEAMEPYYVIDGIPGMSLAMVAPQDIESIDVLCDASATAIYGSKAANGVILITTKKGNKSGMTNVTYNGYVAFDNVLKTLDMMSAKELRDYAEKNNIVIPNDEGADTDWQKETLRTAISHNHNISMNGGNGNTSYNTSVNYLVREGVVDGTKMERLIGRSFLETKTLKDHLTLSFNLNGSMTKNKTVPTGGSGQSVYNAMYYYSPLCPVKNEDGTWFSDSGVSQNYNPLSMVYEDRYRSETRKLQGTAKAALTLIDGLVWNNSISHQEEQWIWNEYNTTQSQIVPSRHGQANRRTSTDNKTVFESYINFDRTYNDAHKVGAMIGYSWEEGTKSDGFGLTVYDFFNDDLEYHNLNLGNRMNFEEITSWTPSTLRMISFFGRLNYSYNSKYILQATVRRDGSSAFGKNNRWGTFPSASVAWRASEEDFIKDIDVISDMKLRVGYGVSGNSLGFDAYTAIQTYGPDNWFEYQDPKTGEIKKYRTLKATKNANPDLKWERTSMLNVGIDLGFMDNRFRGTIEFYSKKTSDLIHDYKVSTNRYPYDRMIANVGEISNKGFELSISATPVRTSDLTWETGISISHNKNTVEKLSNQTYSEKYIDRANTDIGGFGRSQIQRIMEGCPIGQFYMWEWAGYNDEGLSVFNDYDEDGNLIGVTDAPDEEDRRKAGVAQPKVTFGWNNTISYKKLSLAAFFQGVAGNKIFNATRCYYNNVGLVKAGKNVLKEVSTMQHANDTRAQAPSNRYLENGSYLRLSSLSLTYDLGNIGDYVKDIKLTATCNNVFTITGYKGLDPEVSLGGLEPGIEWRNSAYPRTRTFMIGANINF